MKKYLNLGLNLTSLVVVVAMLVTHFEYSGIQTIALSVAAVIGGYWLGILTCHVHKKSQGFWLTLVVFIVLNLGHSLIDGASIGGSVGFWQGIAVLSHEFARQPALYVVLWGMLTPFINAKWKRIVIVPIVVSGTWLVGIAIGMEAQVMVSSVSWLETVADMGMYIFLGDILHHVVEEYQKVNSADQKSCCHQH